MKLPVLLVTALLCSANLYPQQPASDTPAWVLLPQEFNDGLPSWLQLHGEYRTRAEGQEGLNFARQNDGYLLSRWWIDATVQPTNWLKLFGQMQDSRVFFNRTVSTDPPRQNLFDLHQAFLELGDLKKSPISLRVGRQELSFGGERLIGPSHWLNAPRVFDAVRVAIQHSGYRVDLFSSSVIQSRDGVVDHHSQGDNLHGLYGSVSKLIPKAVIEPYFFWRLEPASLTIREISERGHLNEKTFGFRWAGSLPMQFDYETEMARQAGTLGSASIHAWAGYWIFGRRFVHAPGKPRAYVEYNYASGDKDPNDRVSQTFDQIYPSSHDKLGFADLIGWRNIHNFRLRYDFALGKKWKIKTSYDNFWLASAYDGLYGSSGTLSVKSANGRTGRHVGQELDGQAIYHWNSAVEFSFGYAHLFTGDFLNQTTAGKDFNYPFGSMTYSF
jgi:hypothetical protein